MAHLDEVIFKPFADQAARLNALQSDGEIDLAQTIVADRHRDDQGRPDLQVIDRGESCNTAGSQMNQTHKPFDNLKIRTAIAYAVNKQAYIDAFYAGLAEPADNWMPPAPSTTSRSTCRPTTSRRRRTRSRRPVVSATCSSSTSTTRPTSPARTCPIRRAWSRRSPTTSRPSASRSPSTPRAGGPATWPTSPSGSSRCGSSAGPVTGRARQLPRHGVLPLRRRQAEPGVRLRTAGPEDHDRRRRRRPDEAAAKAPWESAQDILAKDLPTVPLVNSTPPAASKSYVKGFLGAGNLNEPLPVWLDK